LAYILAGMSGIPPKISIITVNFNMADQIAGTLDSVLAQDYPNFESIVIDGASTDGSQAIIASYGARLACFVSEQDRNLYDGMNKGVRAATGDWVLFMNSGDRFADHRVLSEMFAADHSDADALYGHHVRRYPAHGIDRTIRAESPTVLPLRMHCSHQSLFMRREILLRRPFSLSLLAADYDAILAAYLDGRRFKLVECVVAVASVGGRSDTNRLIVLMQRISIVRRHGLLNLYTAFHYAMLIARVMVADPLKRILPRPLVTFVLRHQPIKRLG
jgi:glycosyltransferase involved in cell wall biosynthesis